MAYTLTKEALLLDLHAAFQSAKRKKASKPYVHVFEKNLDANINSLADDLINRTYQPEPSSCFVVQRPKKREVFAAQFRDRVVQRAMCDTGLYDDLTRSNIHDNAACQIGKGTTFAMDRLSCHLQRFWRRHGTDGWVLRLDIRKFFDSIPHAQLKEMVASKVRNPEYRGYVLEIIDSFDDPGIGLGSQISQLLAISYLSDLDHLAKERLGIRHYVRYSDDIVMVHESREHLARVWKLFRDGLAALGLSLNPKSTLHPLRHGVDFLKFKFRLTATGKVVRILNRRSPRRIQKRLKGLVRKYKAGERSWDDAINCFNSWKAHAEQGNSRNKIRRIQQWLTQQS